MQWHSHLETKLMYRSRELPDVTSAAIGQNYSFLDWVGMEKIALPILFPVSQNESIGVSVDVDAFVSLDKDVKGIHMSRLYFELQNQLANQCLSSALLHSLLNEMTRSQNGISNNAMVRLRMDLPLKKSALVTDNYGYQNYSIEIEQSKGLEKNELRLSVTIPYSSTCPCSASLASQLISEAIDEHFEETTLNKQTLLSWLTSDSAKLATPHNQRSYAYISMVLYESELPDIPSLIFELESVIGTPVQTAVKRADEQAFAKLNGESLMFCEDAGRKLTHYLDRHKLVSQYSFKVEHQESLHAHDAVVLHKGRSA